MFVKRVLFQGSRTLCIRVLFLLSLVLWLGGYDGDLLLNPKPEAKFMWLTHLLFFVAACAG